jgi:hypothetical protein
MEPANVTTRWLPAAAGLVLALTALGALLSTIAPALAGHTRPHPTLTGSLGDALAILQNNLRVLAAPFLLCLLKFPASRLGRRAGDLLILALAADSVIPVGLELGRWHAKLLPYLPQLPLEWAALTVAITAWLTARHDHMRPRQLAVLATTTAALLAGAASIETWGAPQRHKSSAASQAEVDTVLGRLIDTPTPLGPHDVTSMPRSRSRRARRPVPKRKRRCRPLNTAAT